MNIEMTHSKYNVLFLWLLLCQIYQIASPIDMIRSPYSQFQISEPLQKWHM